MLTKIITELRELLYFELICIKRAITDTIDHAGFKLLVISPILFVLGSAISIYFLGWGYVISDITINAVSAVGAVISAAVILFVYYLLLAPSRVYSDKKLVVSNAKTISKHDVSLLDAIYYAAKGEWTCNNKLISNDKDTGDKYIVDDDTINRVTHAYKDVRQKAVDGDLPIWGVKDIYSELYELIDDPSYWTRHWLDWSVIMHGKDEEGFSLDDMVGVDANDPRRHDTLYYSYTTSKKIVEEIWPPDRN